MRKRYNENTGVFEFYDSLTRLWLDAESAALGGGIFDIFSQTATKLTSEGAKKVAEKAVTAGARKAGEKAAEYASERLFKKN